MKRLLSSFAIIVVLAMLVGTAAIANTNDGLTVSDQPENISAIEFDEIASDAQASSDADEEITSDAVVPSDAEITSDADKEVTSDAEITSDAEAEIPSVDGGNTVITPDDDKEITSDAEVDSDADVDVASDAVAFADLSADDWAYDAIMVLVEKGIVSGDDEGTIRPDGNVTREEVAKMMIVARGFEIGSDAALDIADPESVADWAKGYMATAIEKGIISGYEDGTVKGNSVVNRAELATIIVRSLNASIDNFDETSFADVTTDDWYAKYVECAKTLGVVNGYEDGTFKGEATVTRREAFAMVQRLVKLLEALEA